jgi:ribulose-phosphate 3-epimerase
MDGRFVPNLTLGPPIIKALRPHSALPFDVHLMMVEPERMLADFAKAGANTLTVHQEVSPHLHRTLTQIRELGCRAGVSINPSTPAETLEYVLPLCDLVLVMTVNPGFGGQKFITSGIEKVGRLRAMANKLNPALDIEVDGGINKDTIGEIARAGANVFVAGNAIFSEKDYASAITTLRQAAQ